MASASRANALHGPWEQRHYPRASGTSYVFYYDSTGDRVTICLFYERAFGDLLEKAWAVPQLMDMLQRVINLYEYLVIAEDDDENEAAHAAARVGTACIEARRLLERLT